MGFSIRDKDSPIFESAKNIKKHQNNKYKADIIPQLDIL